MHAFFLIKSFQLFQNNGSIQEGDLLFPNDLKRLMSAAGDHQNIAGMCRMQSLTDRLATIRHDLVRSSR